MSRDKTDVVDAREIDREGEGNVHDTQTRLYDDAYEKNTKAAPEIESNERGGVVARDARGRVTRVDYPDGVTYEFGKFDQNGNPTRIKITSQGQGTFGQWNKESDGLWRAYSGDTPGREVLEGEMRVDNQGIVHRDGKQAFRDLPAADNKGYTEQPSPKLTRDGAGNISSVVHPNGVKYEFRGYGDNGQPTSVKITQRGDKDFGEWKKEQDGLWRAYHNGKPTSEVIVGEWLVNEKGEMRHTGRQDMQPVARHDAGKIVAGGTEKASETPPPAPAERASFQAPAEAPALETNERGGVVARDARGRVTRVDYPDGVTYEFGKFDQSGNPTRIKITSQGQGTFGQWNKESDGLWRAYSGDTPRREVLEGEMRVDNQGIVHRDGKQAFRDLPAADNKGYTEQPSPKLTRDGAGNISSVEHPNGVKYEFRGHDDSGQPTSVKITQRGHKDFGEWKKERDGLWRAYNNGKPTSEVIVGEWRVNEKGEMSHTGHQDMQPIARAAAEKPSARGGESGERHPRRADKPAEKGAEKPAEKAADRPAEKTAEKTADKPAAKPEQLTTEFNIYDGYTVKRFPDGKAAEITRGNGETTRFKYADGKLSEVSLPGGTVLTTTDGKTWTNSKTGEASELKIEVKEDGSYSLEKGGKKALLLANGCTVRSDVLADGSERVNSITYANGEAAGFKYNADGKLNEVTVPSGAVYSSTDGKTWTSSQGGPSFEAKVEVRSDGRYSIERDGKRSTTGADAVVTIEDLATGSRTVIFPNGTVRMFDGKDMFPSTVMTPDGRELKLTEKTDGQYVIKSGDSLSAIARDLLEADNINIAGYKPSNQEVVDAIDMLVKANKMASKNETIKAGQKLIIPRALAT